ncbi:hypothetical protein AG1IA_00763 [Rhizoctonia solani AG-1 IA]|uniref:Secreted protein n=1 Tax=Thanatephorus cucumeris (strain AG1-IA) TaxID=983506 RepID=L8X4I1_THACA|nr:hypothetical protein AG1IA_00763 [Rhizoctonia solani AG-1 IA]
MFINAIFILSFGLLASDICRVGERDSKRIARLPCRPDVVGVLDRSVVRRTRDIFKFIFRATFERGKSL